LTARVLVLVEGPTENAFVKSVLAPYLESASVQLVPTIVTTRNNPRGRDHKGGFVSRTRLVRQIRNRLGDTAATVTTLLDFYGLAGRESTRAVEEEERALALEVGEFQRFIPYLQKHEFEALLFSDCEKTSQYFGNAQLRPRLEGIVTQCGGAEEINDDPATCPSRRLMALVPEYSKVLDGPAVIRRIGIETMARQCPRFGAWIDKLAGLATP
jgi:hypothetical protein